MYRKYRTLYKIFDFAVVHRGSILGFVGLIYLSHRVGNNMSTLEKDTAEKKLYDPVKAKAQIQVYKEIYNLDNQNKDQAELRIMQSASDDDIQTISKFFEKQEEGKERDDAKLRMDREMEKLKREIDSLEEVTSGHQGFKFYRTLMTQDTFEDALIELREREFDKKFKGDKE
mmetsp:Transcript_8082/g.13568  ORF Transcript_8082/g.13568 Transcript_8082/m.13568 type:complete len:172 (-) Transcript_8082:212-727(-)